jgi:hypothetical protein
VRRLFITLSVLSAVGGVALAVLFFVLGLVSGFDNDKYGKVPLPGAGRVALPEGEVTVFYEERGSYPDGLASYSVRSADTRQPVPSRPSGSSSYEINNVNGTSVDKLTVPREGEYLVRGRTQATTAFNQPALTFGPGIRFGSIVARSLGSLVIGLLLCVLFALLARAFRRRPTAATVPPPHSSAPMAAWQMPQPPPPPPAGADPQRELAQLEEDRRMGRIAEADYQARRKQILDRI